MSVTNVPTSETVTGIIAGAWRDALPLMRSRINVYYVLIAIGAVLALTAALASHGTHSGSDYGASVVTLVASFYAAAAAIRTLRPDFRWTLERVFVVILLGIALAVAIGIGLVLFVIPGIWIGVRLSMTYYAYLMPEGDANPFAVSWHLTAHLFWHTLGLLFLVSFINFAVGVAVAIVLGMLGLISPWIEGLVAIPGLYVDFLLMNFAVLAHVRWFAHLRHAHGMPGLPVPA